MKRWKKVGIFLWSALPFIVLANISNIETDALERAYARKECKYQADKSREKDFKAKYDEGFENGRSVGYGQAKVVAFDFLIEILEGMGEIDKEEEKEVTTANLESNTNSI
tara:strand:+ start:96 stop:425 length:330 start_codon:yes stop_codon:yes gene_type:complete